MSAESPVTDVFVYGTLKRGQCRESCWPHPPTKVEAATIGGRLYDLGPYPAVVEGDGRVDGELWHFAAAHVGETLAVLDDVEDAAVGASGLYVRRLVPCVTDDGHTHPAHAYFYTRPETIGSPPVAPGPDGCCRWPQGGPVTP